jgi:hypothetical protein
MKTKMILYNALNEKLDMYCKAINQTKEPLHHISYYFPFWMLLINFQEYIPITRYAWILMESTSDKQKELQAEMKKSLLTGITAQTFSEDKAKAVNWGQLVSIANFKKEKDEDKDKADEVLFFCIRIIF